MYMRIIIKSIGHTALATDHGIRISNDNIIILSYGPPLSAAASLGLPFMTTPK